MMKINRWFFLVVSVALTAPFLSSAKTRFYRLSWREDPSTTMVVGWDQASGTKPVLHYGTKDQGEEAKKYSFSKEPDRTQVYLGMTNCFVRLRKLKPDTPYYFVIQDSEGTSRRLWFRTAPASPKPFTFISGGDSRMDRDQSEKIRQIRCRGNQLVAALRPLFILYGGDYVFKKDADRWEKWFQDWQLTITKDGRMAPIVPVHGNHENYDMQVLSAFFDIPPEQYFALNVSGKLFRMWVLNSELKKPAEIAAQNKWLEKDLKAHRKTKWKMAAYHQPIRPHTKGKPDRDYLYDWWADLFFTYGMNVVAESDTHLSKRTYPIRPSTDPDADAGFVRDDKRGTVFIGEGSWGAPTRPANNARSWTMATEKVNQFKWIQVFPNKMLIRSVLFEKVDQVVPLTEKNLFEEPENMVFWTPKTGKILQLPFNSKDLD
jgi:hypothetical protein